MIRQKWVIAASVVLAAAALLVQRATSQEPVPRQHPLPMPAPATLPAVDIDAMPAGALTGSVNLRRTVTVAVVQKTKDAVVNISSTKLVNQRVSPFGGDPLFQQFDFGQSVRVPAQSLGSGFLIHHDGYVVTNNHVVDRARQIHVELADGRKLPADLVSTDPDADLAILRIQGNQEFPALELGDSSDLMIGEPVIAVGNPLGYSHSVSTGIVSAVHRDIANNKKQQASDAPLRGEQAALRDLVQTDAAINPGNSGGPLLNAYGQVIGINTAIRSDAQNIGFAIPINRLRDLIPELMNPAQVSKVNVPLALVERRKIVEPATVEVQIARAGDKPMLLKSINGKQPANIVDAYVMLLTIKANQPFEVIWAGGTAEHFTPQPTPAPDVVVQAKKHLGVEVEAVTPMMAEKYQLGVEDGIFITGVDRGSVAEKAGLQPGDIIVQMGRFRVGTFADFATLMQHLPEAGKVRVGVVRRDQLGFAMLEF